MDDVDRVEGQIAFQTRACLLAAAAAQDQKRQERGRCAAHLSAARRVVQAAHLAEAFPTHAEAGRPREIRTHDPRGDMGPRFRGDDSI